MCMIYLCGKTYVFNIFNSFFKYDHFHSASWDDQRMLKKILKKINIKPLKTLDAKRSQIIQNLDGHNLTIKLNFLVTLLKKKQML